MPVFILNTEPVLDHITDDRAYGFVELQDLQNSLKMRLKGEMHALEKLIRTVPRIISKYTGEQIPWIEEFGLRYDKNGNVETYIIR